MMNPEPQKTESFADNIQTGLGLADLVGGPASVVTREFGSSGHRAWGLASFLGTLSPLITVQAKAPGQPPPAPGQNEAALFTSGTLLLGWFVHRAASQQNRGRCHSREMGRTRFCRRLRPNVELAVGLGVAWALSYASDAVAGLMCFSAFGNWVTGRAVLAKQDLEVINADDARWSGQNFAHGMERLRGRD